MPPFRSLVDRQTGVLPVLPLPSSTGAPVSLVPRPSSRKCVTRQSTNDGLKTLLLSALPSPYFVLALRYLQTIRPLTVRWFVGSTKVIVFLF